MSHQGVRYQKLLIISSVVRMFTTQILWIDGRIHISIKCQGEIVRDQYAGYVSRLTLAFDKWLMSISWYDIDLREAQSKCK